MNGVSNKIHTIEISKTNSPDTGQHRYVLESIEKACEKHDWVSNPCLDDLLHLETWTTDFVKKFT